MLGLASLLAISKATKIIANEIRIK